MPIKNNCENLVSANPILVLNTVVMLLIKVMIININRIAIADFRESLSILSVPKIPSRQYIIIS